MDWQKLIKTVEKVSNSAEKIVSFIQKYGSITTEDAEKLLAVKQRRARKILADLALEGLIEKVGRIKGSYYVIKNG